MLNIKVIYLIITKDVEMLQKNSVVWKGIPGGDLSNRHHPLLFKRGSVSEGLCSVRGGGGSYSLHSK